MPKVLRARQRAPDVEETAPVHPACRILARLWTSSGRAGTRTLTEVEIVEQGTPGFARNPGMSQADHDYLENLTDSILAYVYGADAPARWAELGPARRAYLGLFVPAGMAARLGNL